jgi:RHS repeat-associated protein
VTLVLGFCLVFLLGVAVFSLSRPTAPLTALLRLIALLICTSGILSAHASQGAVKGHKYYKGVCGSNTKSLEDARAECQRMADLSLQNPQSEYTSIQFGAIKADETVNMLDGERISQLVEITARKKGSSVDEIKTQKLADVAAECPGTDGFGTGNAPTYEISPAGTTPTASISYCSRTVPDQPALPKPCGDQCDGTVGNPVDLSTRSKREKRDDYSGPYGLKQTYEYISEYKKMMENHKREMRLNFEPGPSSPSCYPGVGSVSGFSYCFPFIKPPYADDKRAVMLEDGRQVRFDVNTLVVDSKDGHDVVKNRAGGGWEIRNGKSGTTASYDANGRYLSYKTQDGRTFSLVSTPVPNGSILTVTDDFGHSLALYYDATGRLTHMTDPAGELYQYGYDALGNQISVTYPDNTVKQFVYELAANPHALTGVIDENLSRYSTFGYHPVTGYATSTEHGTGGIDRHTLVYDSDSQITHTDPLGTERVLQLTAVEGGARYVTSVTRPCGTPGCSGTVTATMPLNFLLHGNPQFRTDFNGNKTCYEYVLARNLESARAEGIGTAPCPSVSSWVPTVNTAQRKISTEWHDDWPLVRRMAEPLRITTHTYHGVSGASCAPSDASTALVCSTTVQPTTDVQGGSGFSATSQGAARVWNFEYDLYGRPTKVNGPRTDVTDETTYTYYANNAGQGLNRGMLWKVTNALNQVTTFSNYDAHGNVQTITDPNGLVTTLEYDLRLRLKKVTSGGEATQYQYDDAGQLKKLIRPDLSFVQFHYDAAHRLYSLNDSEGNRIDYVLDNAGNRLEEQTYDQSNTLTRLLKREFDTLNRLKLTRGGTNPTAQVTTHGYDHESQLKTITDALTRTTTNDYDNRYRLTSVEDPVNGPGAKTQFAYDALDRLVKVTDAKALNTTYEYTGFGDLLKQTSPDTGITEFTHDPSGNVLSKKDARNITATYTYDALNRVKTIAYPATSGAPAELVTYTYDTCAYGIGRLCEVQDNTGTTQWTYTIHGRIESQTRITPANGAIPALMQTLGYEYNTAGQLKKIITPAQNNVEFTYAHNRIATVSVNGSVVATDIVYEPFGPIGGWKWQNSTPTTPNLHLRITDLDYRTTQVLSDQPQAGVMPVLKRDIEWDHVSRISKITDPSNPINTFTYSYDGLDRLTSATPTTGSPFAYTFDGVGNRLTHTANGSTTTYNYSTPFTTHRLNGLSSGALYTYDAVGNLTSDGATTWKYSGKNRPFEVQTNLGTIPFAINALGQRVMKGSGLAATRYFYNEAGQLIGEYSASGSLIQETVWLGDLPIAITKTLVSGPGKPVFLANAVSGATHVWPMQGKTILPTEGDLRPVTDPNWTLAATGDFDGDGKLDVLWRNATTGDNYIWFLDGTTIKATEGYTRNVAGPDWTLAATGDFDDDGKTDFVWRNTVNGDNYLWFMDSLAIKSTEGYIRTVAPAWTLMGAGDTDGDGKGDLVWRNTTTGEMYLYPMDGLNIKATEGPMRTSADMNWKITGSSDFDGDGKSDLLWWNQTTGETYLWPLNGTTIGPMEGALRTLATLDWKVAQSADYDGDGKADLLLKNHVTGEHYLWPLEGTNIKPSEGTVRTVSDLNWKIVPNADKPALSSKSLSTTAATGTGPGNPKGMAKTAPNVVVYYVHGDQLGTPRAITRPWDNKVVWRNDNTEPFGNSQPNENPSGLGNFKFNGRGTGQYYDDETGLLWNGYRVLNTKDGRYIQSDPIGLAGGINTYAHVGGNPLKFIDPLGLAIGDLPPPPPGYDPYTWRQLQWDNGRWFLRDPNKNVWTIHPEDEGHWRHWDKQDKDGNDDGTWPPNNGKPWKGQKKLKKHQCETDPSGDKKPWEPIDYFSPNPLMDSLLNPQLPNSAPNSPKAPVRAPTPFRVPLPVW